MTTFQLGDLILTSKPYAYVLNNVCRGSRCDFCFKKSSDLKRCSQCSFLYFCDKECQANAWNTHKAECKLLLKVKPKLPTDSIRLISLILLKLKKHGFEEPCEEIYGRKVTFKTLMSHSEEINKNVKSMQQIIAMIGTLRDYIGQSNIPLPSDFIDIFGKMCINTFSICDNEMQSIGSGLYLGASIFDHSCEPNAEVVFDGINLSVRATKNLPSTEISQIFISYIDQLQLTEERLNVLKEQYYFNCQCSRCTSSHLNDMMKKVLVDEDVSKKVTGFNQELERLKDMKKNHVTAEVLYDACIQELGNQEEILADTHICKIKTLEIAFDACIETNKWTEAVLIGKKLIEPYKLFYGPYHPTLGIHTFKLGKIQTFIDSPIAQETLQKAESILKVTHGEKHALYQDLLKVMHG